MIEIGKLRDVTISLTHLMLFRPPEEKDLPGMNAICLNTGHKIDTMMEYLDEYFAACDRGEV